MRACHSGHGKTSVPFRLMYEELYQLLFLTGETRLSVLRGRPYQFCVREAGSTVFISPLICEVLATVYIVLKYNKKRYGMVQSPTSGVFQSYVDSELIKKWK